MPHFICSRVARGIFTDQLTSIPCLKPRRLLIVLEWSCLPPLCIQLLSWPLGSQALAMPPSFLLLEHTKFILFFTIVHLFAWKLCLPELFMAGSIFPLRSYPKGFLPRLSLTSHSKVTWYPHPHDFMSQNNIISHNDSKHFLNTLIRRERQFQSLFAFMLFPLPSQVCKLGGGCEGPQWRL